MKQTRYTALIVPLGILCIAIFLFAYRLTTPFDGVQPVPGAWNFTAEGVQVTPLENQPDGIHEGDLVVAVAGRNLDTWAQSLLDPQATRPQWQAGQTVTYTVLRGAQHIDIPVKLTSYPFLTLLAYHWSNWLIIAVFAVLATFIFLQRPDNRSIRILLLWISCLIGDLVFWTVGLQVSDIVMGTGFWLQSVAQHFAFLLFCSSILHFTLIFPAMQLPRQRFGWLVPAIYGLPLLVYLVCGVALLPGSNSALAWIGRWIKANDALTVVLLLTMLLSLVSGYRDTKLTTLSRRQARLVVLAMALCGICFICLTLAHFFVNGVFYRENSLTWLLFLLGLLVPVALIFAIVRYRLFRIRVIISRTLIYSSLTITLVALYILIVGTLSQIFETSGNFYISLVATGLIAAIVHPLRVRLQRTINRLIYGQRDDPYAVLFGLGKRLEGTLAPGEALPILIETLVLALKLPFAAIALGQGDSFVVTASYGVQQPGVIRVPIVYQRDVIGQLILAPRSPGEAFTHADLQLLDNLAQQAGVAAYTVRLTNDLQRSREQLVSAREEERRRLRRDLHDGLGPVLASMILKLEGTRSLLTRDPSSADKMLVDLTSRAETVIADIRRLVYELRPPALDDLGLVPALTQYALQHNATGGLQISIQAPDILPPLPAALEVAVYRIVLEAVTNVIRHARANHCQVNITLNNGLALEISDDGRGLPTERRNGVGLNSMRERSAELGGTFSITSRPEGGTRILAQLPWIGT